MSDIDILEATLAKLESGMTNDQMLISVIGGILQFVKTLEDRIESLERCLYDLEWNH
jgi:hypothetical protein